MNKAIIEAIGVDLYMGLGADLCMDLEMDLSGLNRVVNSEVINAWRISNSFNFWSYI
jgi:hypothetical protein